MEVGRIINGVVLRQAQQVGIKSGPRAVWEKETRDRIKVLKMGLGDTSGPHHFYLVSWQAESICCVTTMSFSCIPSHVSRLLITLSYLCYFLVQGLSPSWRS